MSGDGAIFSDSFLNRGREGGRDAAAALNAGLKSYLESYNATLSNHDNRSKTDDMNGFSTSRIMSPQIVCTIYFNRMGLCNTLQANTVCTSQRFLDFFVGFNQASPLYTLVDVGDGKEAADAKLRESLKLHARLPQTRKVIFGGAHDNGYMPTLISLATEGHLDKLVILKGSANMAHEIDRFRSQAAVDLITIPGLFLQKKLVSPSFLQPTMSPNPFSMPLFAQPNLSYITPNETGSSTPERQNTPAKQPSPTKTAQRAPRSKRDDASSSNRTTTPTTTVSSPPPTSDGKHVLPGLSSQGMPSPVHRLDPKKSFGKHRTVQAGVGVDAVPVTHENHLCPETQPCAKLASNNCKFLHDQPGAPPTPGNPVALPPQLQTPTSTSGLSLSEAVLSPSLLARNLTG
ncbi:hypothetical protein FRB93_005003 [Tulasnella sp. JGI-2019a]|nr:hypothetical protein FRB93_005003 [Tulasnella sp. JGI-2019a]